MTLSNTRAPNARSTSRVSSAAARIGNASSTRIDVTRMFQVKIGIRNMVMPGARIVKMVVMKLTPPRMVPRPDSASPMIHMSAPAPGEWTTSFSGAYANQPKSAAPPGVRKPATTVRLPNRKK